MQIYSTRRRGGVEGGGPGRREEGGAHDTRLKLDTKEIELIIDLYFKNIFFFVVC